jgi:cold shock CspA family protein
LGFWHERGFTFIKSDAGHGDFFCHVSDLHASLKDNLFDADGNQLDSKHSSVVFDAVVDPRDPSRLRAVNVRLATPSPAPKRPAVGTQPDSNKGELPPKHSGTPADAQPQPAPTDVEPMDEDATPTASDPIRSSSPQSTPRDGNIQNDGAYSGEDSVPPARSRSTSPRSSSEQLTTLSRGGGRSRSPTRSSRSASRGAALLKAASRSRP